MASSLIRGKYVISPMGSGGKGVATRHDAAVYQEDGVIKDIGGYRELRERYQADAELGGPTYAIIPGLVNSHHHGRGVTTLQMGTCDDCLETWILAGWGRRPYDHYLMTLYTALNMAGIRHYHGDVQPSADGGGHAERGRGRRAVRLPGRRYAGGVFQLPAQPEPGGLWRRR